MYSVKDIDKYDSVLLKRTIIDIRKGWHDLLLGFLDETQNLKYKIIHVKNNNDKIKIIYYSDCNDSKEKITKFLDSLEKCSSRICERCGKIHDSEGFDCCR